jgi:hypothetical protein
MHLKFWVPLGEQSVAQALIYAASVQPAWDKFRLDNGTVKVDLGPEVEINHLQGYIFAMII